MAVFIKMFFFDSVIIFFENIYWDLLHTCTCLWLIKYTIFFERDSRKYSCNYVYWIATSYDEEAWWSQFKWVLLVQNFIPEIVGRNCIHNHFGQYLSNIENIIYHRVSSAHFSYSDDHIGGLCHFPSRWIGFVTLWKLLWMHYVFDSIEFLKIAINFVISYSVFDHWSILSTDRGPYEHWMRADENHQYELYVLIVFSIEYKTDTSQWLDEHFENMHVCVWVCESVY